MMTSVQRRLRKSKYPTTFVGGQSNFTNIHRAFEEHGLNDVTKKDDPKESFVSS